MTETQESREVRREAIRRAAQFVKESCEECIPGSFDRLTDDQLRVLVKLVLEKEGYQVVERTA